MSAICLQEVTKAWGEARAVDGSGCREHPSITVVALMTSGPLPVAFLLFQKQFVQSFMRAGIR